MEQKLYYQIHYWLRKNYGQANKCENPNCKKESLKYEWALKHKSQYDFNINNFIQLCKQCHTNYDMTEEWKNNLKSPGLGNKNAIGHKQVPWNKGLKGDPRSCVPQPKLFNKKRPIKICPYCGTEGGPGNMERWHFENCKYKNK